MKSKYLEQLAQLTSKWACVLDYIYYTYIEKQMRAEEKNACVFFFFSLVLIVTKLTQIWRLEKKKDGMNGPVKKLEVFVSCNKVLRKPSSVNFLH